MDVVKLVDLDIKVKAKGIIIISNIKNLDLKGDSFHFTELHLKEHFLKSKLCTLYHQFIVSGSNYTTVKYNQDTQFRTELLSFSN